MPLDKAGIEAGCEAAPLHIPGGSVPSSPGTQSLPLPCWVRPAGPEGCPLLRRSPGHVWDALATACVSVLRPKINLLRGGGGSGLWGRDAEGMPEGKHLFLPLLACRGFVLGKQMFSTCSLLGHCYVIIYGAWELQAWWAFNLLNKEYCAVCRACTQVELVLSFGIPWDRGEGWSIPWQCPGTDLLQCHELPHMQSIDFPMCKQQFWLEWIVSRGPKNPVNSVGDGFLCFRGVSGVAGWGGREQPVRCF